jgi:hypothetical protein
VARERVRQVTSHNVRGKEKLGETTFLRVIKNMRASAALKAMARLFASAWGRRYARLCMYGTQEGRGMEFGNAAAVAEGAGSRGAGQRWRHEVGLGILGCLQAEPRD